GPGGAPDPTIIQTAPRPDYFFRWLYAVLSLLPPSLETPALLIVPGIVLLVLLALPFVSGEGEKSWRRRPIAVLTILLLAVALGSFTHLSGHAPWSPVMDAWSGEPIPAHYLKERTALERQGALVFQVKQCHNCHALDAHGGQRGPTLDAVAVRLTHDQLIRQVIQGGGNMPAYGKNLSPAETTALVAFLETLHPGGQAPARDASHAVASSLRMAVAPPYILIAAPVLPLQYGLPWRSARRAVQRLLRSPPARSLRRFLTRPVVCWLAPVAALIGWHVPAVFELGVRSRWWHD